MVKESHRTIVLLVSLFVFLCGLTISSSANTITLKMREADPRLNVRVTVTPSRLLIGELLERLSKQTGVALRMDEQEAASGIPILLSLSDIPLASAMNGLTSLVSSRAAVWRWIREYRSGAYQYWLRPPSMEELARGAKQRAQEEFEKEVELLMKAARMSPSEREKLKDKNPPNASMIADPRVLGGVMVFAQSLSPSERLRVMRNGEKIIVKVDQLSPEGQAFVASESRSEVAAGPTLVVFHADRSPLDITPTLYMQLEGLGGYGYAGGGPLNKQMHAEFKDHWMLPGDEKDDPLSARQIAEKGAEPPESDLLMQMAVNASISLMAAPPKNSFQLVGAPVGKTVAQFLEDQWEYPPRLMSKWREHILLVSHPIWFLEADTYPPYRVVKQWRAAARKNRGILPLALRAEAAATLRPEPLATLLKEFPFTDHVAAWRNFFVLYHRFPEVGRGEPWPLTAEMRRLLLTVPGTVPDELPKARAARIRLERRPNTEPVEWLTHFELFDEDGKRISWNSFLSRETESPLPGK